MYIYVVILKYTIVLYSTNDHLLDTASLIYIYMYDYLSGDSVVSPGCFPNLIIINLLSYSAFAVPSIGPQRALEYCGRTRLVSTYFYA